MAESVIPASAGIALKHPCAAAQDEAPVTQRFVSSESDAHADAHCGEEAPHCEATAAHTCSHVGTSAPPIGAAHPINKLHTATSQSDRIRLSFALR